MNEHSLVHQPISGRSGLPLTHLPLCTWYDCMYRPLKSKNFTALSHYSLLGVGPYSRVGKLSQGLPVVASWQQATNRGLSFALHSQQRAIRPPKSPEIRPYVPASPASQLLNYGVDGCSSVSHWDSGVSSSRTTLQLQSSGLPWFRRQWRWRCHGDPKALTW